MDVLRDFFTSSFFFPGGEDARAFVLEQLEDPDAALKYPSSHDIPTVFLYAAAISVFRLVMKYLLVLPIARNALPKKRRVLQPDPQLEKLFQVMDRPSGVILKPVLEQKGRSKDKVQNWFGLRRAQVRYDARLRKFEEAWWQALFYSFTIWLGFYVLHDKPWFAEDTKHCWYEYPRHEISAGLRFYYLVSLAFYVHMTGALFLETRRKDFWEMFLHHVCTILLITFSYTANLLRIGSLVLLVHDVADPFLHVGKLFNYAKWQKTCDAMFVVFAIVFAVSRLYVYPLFVINSSYYESYEVVGYWPGVTMFNTLLIILQLLHFFWFSIIAKMAYGFLVKGAVEGDDRSDTDATSGDDYDDWKDE